MLLKIIQLIGRAGRDGSPSLAHIFTDLREVKQTKDGDLASFISSKENCRRRILLEALGSAEELSRNSVGMCCDVCSPNIRTSAVNVFRRVAVTRQPRRLLVRTVTRQQQERLKKALEMERENIMGSSVGYCMLGKELVLPTRCILEICKRAQYIQSQADISLVPGLRRELVSCIYDAFVSFFST